MTTFNKTTLKTFFQQGDIPTGTNYSDFIDSCVNVVETASQSLAGPLAPTELATARVSAGNVNITGTLTIAGQTSGAGANFSGDVSADRVCASAASINNNVTIGGALAVSANVSAASITVNGDVSAATGTVYASAVRSTNGVFNGVGIVSAAGTSQGTAAVLTNVVNRGKGIADGTTTGFTPMANRAGLVQYLFNEGASANLWPPVGGTINGLAANAAFSLAASAMVTIVHLTASAMAVK